MKRLLVIALCFTVILGISSTAYSQEEKVKSNENLKTGLYISADIGAALLNDSEWTDSTVPGFRIDIDNAAGIGFGVAVGYAFNKNFRLEGELAYQQNDIDHVSALGVSLDAKGDSTSLAFLVNGYVDFYNNSPFSSYIGAGIGYARVDINDFNLVGLGLPNYNDKDTVFAYQLCLGIGYAISEKVTFDIKYRFFQTENLEFDTSEIEYSSHNIYAGIRYSF